jgi:hypothetical protein
LTTNGDLLYGTGSGALARRAIGTTGQVLTVAGGIPTWATASSGSMTLIRRSSFSSVADTGTTFDSVFSSSYGSYILVFETIFAGTSGAALHLQFRYAGPTTQSTNYYNTIITINASTPTWAATQQSATNQMTVALNTGATGNNGSGSISLFNLSGVTALPYAASTYSSGSGSLNIYQTNTILDQSRTYTGFLLKASTSNITGTVSIYGLA